MYCYKCGTENEDTAEICLYCGEYIRPAAAQRPDEDPALKLLVPIGVSIWAVGALFLGFLSLLPVFAPFAILFGALALRDIKRHPEKQGRGRAIFGIVMGIIFTLVLILIFATHPERSPRRG